MRRILSTRRLIVIGVLALLLTVITLVLGERLDLRKSVHLPELGGPYAVGRVSMEWHRPIRLNEPLHAHDLIAWVWYPAETPSGTAKRAPYLPSALEEAWRKHGEGWLNRALTRDPHLVQPRAYDAPDLSAAQRTYPVVLLGAGLAAPILQYTSLAEALASHGYIVVGFDAPYRTFLTVLNDGTVILRSPANDPERMSGDAAERTVVRLMKEWTEDMRFAADQLIQLDANSNSPFVGRLDLARIGVVGHSLGGAVAAEFCRVDARCKIGIDLDGALHGDVIQSGIGRPFAFVRSDHRGANDPNSLRIQAEIEHVANSIPTTKPNIVTIPGASHFGFSDQGLLKSSIVVRGLQALGIMKLAPEEQLAKASGITLGFLDKGLKNGGF